MEGGATGADASLHLSRSSSRAEYLIETVPAKREPVVKHAAVKQIGAGSYGKVFAYGSRWCVKYTNDADDARFEVSMNAKARCKYVVPVFALNHPCAIALPRHRPLTTREASEDCGRLQELLVESARYLWRRGMAYTDITPSNIVRCASADPRDCRYMLCDSGSLRFVSTGMPYESTLWVPELYELARMDAQDGNPRLLAPDEDVLSTLALAYAELIAFWGESLVDLRLWSHGRRPGLAWMAAERGRIRSVRRAGQGAGLHGDLT